MIGIPFYVWDLAERFKQDVVDDFVAEYAAGRTPNPCLRCNEKIKFEAVLDRALALGFDAVCTGHYARIDGAPWHAAAGRRPGKDQSYVLAVLTRDQIAHAMFPLGDTPKRRSGTRRPSAACWSRTSRTATTSASSPTATPGVPGPAAWHRAGKIVDADGAVLGAHEGAFGFTVGQRKGLRLDRPAPDGNPRYVLSIEPVSNTVTVGPAAALSGSPRSPRSAPCGPAARRRRRRSSARSSSGRTARSSRALPGWHDGTNSRSACAGPPGRRRRSGGRPLRRRHSAWQRHDRGHPLNRAACNALDSWGRCLPRYGWAGSSLLSGTAPIVIDELISVGREKQ